MAFLVVGISWSCTMWGKPGLGGMRLLYGSVASLRRTWGLAFQRFLARWKHQATSSVWPERLRARDFAKFLVFDELVNFGACYVESLWKFHMFHHENAKSLAAWFALGSHMAPASRQHVSDVASADPPDWGCSPSCQWSTGTQRFKTRRPKGNQGTDCIDTYWLTLVSQIVDTKYGRFFKAGIVVDKASFLFVFGMCDHDQKWISAERIVLQDATIKSISMVWYGTTRTTAVAVASCIFQNWEWPK